MPDVLVLLIGYAAVYLVLCLLTPLAGAVLSPVLAAGAILAMNRPRGDSIQGLLNLVLVGVVAAAAMATLVQLYRSWRVIRGRPLGWRGSALLVLALPLLVGAAGLLLVSG